MKMSEYFDLQRYLVIFLYRCHYFDEMDDFKEYDDLSEYYTRRANEITSVRSNGSARKEKLYTFLSPDLSDDQISNLSFCLDCIDSYEAFINDVGTNESGYVEFPDELIQNTHETLKLLYELLSDLNYKIYTVLEVHRYITLIKILENDMFSEPCIKLLQAMFWSEPSKEEIQIISSAVSETKLLSILMHFLTNNRIIQYTLTFISNIIIVSSEFREQFLESRDFFDIIINLHKDDDKQLIKRKLNILVNLLNGKLMETEQERDILTAAVDLSLSLSPTKFLLLLEPLEFLTSIRESISRKIILENHLIDHITQIIDCEKESRRLKAIKILSNICMYEQDEKTLQEMIRFNSHRSIFNFIEIRADVNLISESLNFFSYWFQICETIDNHEFAYPVIDEFKNISFLKFLDCYSFSFKKNCLKIIERILLFGNFDQNSEIITPDIVEKICDIAKESNDDSICEIIISMFSLFINSFRETSNGNNELILEICKTIQNNFDIDKVKEIIDDNQELQDKLESFVELVESYLSPS